MQREHIYFDHNATTPLLPNIKEAMMDITDMPLNPSSMHYFGREAKKILETARTRVAELVGINEDYHVIFTATGTEANNLAIRGLPDYKAVTSTTEHQSLLLNIGFGDIPVDGNGVISLDALRIIAKQLAGSKFLVSIQYANNETGVIQPIKEAAKIVHECGGIIHTDATQAFGKVPFNACALDVDAVTLSAHKFGGPLGAAALVIKKNIPLTALTVGGGQEYRIRPGTQNVPAIHGFGIAAEVAMHAIDSFNELSDIRDFIENQILKISPHSLVFGGKVERLPNTLSITMPNVTNETQVIYFDINGFAVSAGSACSSGKINHPYVQMSMGYPIEVATTGIRISLGLGNTIDQAQKFVKQWHALFTNSSEISLKNAG